MTVIIPPGFCQVTYNWTSILFDSGGAATTHGSVIGEEDPAEWAQGWADVMIGSFVEAMTPDITLTSVVVTANDTAGEVAVGEQGGGEEAQMNAPSVAVLISERTLQRGRRARGRMFLPGLAYDSQVTSSGLMASGYVDDLQFRADGFLNGPGGPGLRPMVVLQRETPTVNPPADPTPPISPPPTVTSLVVQPRVATQRRRLRR